MFRKHLGSGRSEIKGSADKDERTKTAINKKRTLLENVTALLYEKKDKTMATQDASDNSSRRENRKKKTKLQEKSRLMSKSTVVPAKTQDCDEELPKPPSSIAERSLTGCVSAANPSITGGQTPTAPTPPVKTPTKGVRGCQVHTALVAAR